MIAVFSNHIYSTYVYRMSGWEFIHVHAQYLHQRCSRVALSASIYFCLCFSSVFSLSSILFPLLPSSPSLLTLFSLPSPPPFLLPYLSLPPPYD